MGAGRATSNDTYGKGWGGTRQPLQVVKPQGTGCGDLKGDSPVAMTSSNQHMTPPASAGSSLPSWRPATAACSVTSPCLHSGKGEGGGVPAGVWLAEFGRRPHCLSSPPLHLDPLPSPKHPHYYYTIPDAVNTMLHQGRVPVQALSSLPRGGSKAALATPLRHRAIRPYCRRCRRRHPRSTVATQA